jgi:hypothetical protein
MSKFVEAIELYKSDMAAKLGIGQVDETLLTAVTKGLGPSIYNKDSSTVAGSDKTELDRVKERFLIGKLGLPDGPELDAAIAEVVEKFGSGNRSKHRAIFYYLLVQKFGKQDVYGL